MTPLRGKTERGTVLDVLQDKGCGLLLVCKSDDKDRGVLVCHVSALTGVHEEDNVALKWLGKL